MTEGQQSGAGFNAGEQHHGHGPVRETVITRMGDGIPGRRCQSCGLEVAEGDDGFQKFSCQWVQRHNDREKAAVNGGGVN